MAEPLLPVGGREWAPAPVPPAGSVFGYQMAPGNRELSPSPISYSGLKVLSRSEEEDYEE